MVYMCRLLHDDMKDSGLLPVLARLVKAYSARHSPRAYAVDLVVALHTTLRLLTRLNTSGGRVLAHALRAAVPSCSTAQLGAPIQRRTPMT